MIKTKEQIEGIRQAGRINTKVLDYVETHICAGMSTEEIDQMVAKKTKELGGICAPLNYEGFLKVSVQASMMQFVMAYLIRILF